MKDCQKCFDKMTDYVTNCLVRHGLQDKQWVKAQKEIQRFFLKMYKEIKEEKK